MRQGHLTFLHDYRYLRTCLLKGAVVVEQKDWRPAGSDFPPPLPLLGRGRRSNGPKDAHVLNPSTCECTFSCDKGGFAGVIKSGVLRQGQSEGEERSRGQSDLRRGRGATECGHFWQLGKLRRWILPWSLYKECSPEF